MQEILDEARARNPYPEDIFTEPSKEEYEQLRELFRNAGMTQDRFFGSFGRRVWNNCVDEIKRLMEQQEVSQEQSTTQSV